MLEDEGVKGEMSQSHSQSATVSKGARNQLHSILSQLISARDMPGWGHGDAARLQERSSLGYPEYDQDICQTNYQLGWPTLAQGK